jgi:hypothetical protein
MTRMARMTRKAHLARMTHLTNMTLDFHPTRGGSS